MDDGKNTSQNQQNAGGGTTPNVASTTSDQSKTPTSADNQTNTKPKTVEEIQEQVQKDHQGPATDKIISEEIQEREKKIDEDIKAAQAETVTENVGLVEEINEEEKGKQIAEAIAKTATVKSDDNSSVHELEEKI